MIDLVASEWLKLRTLRTAHALLGLAVVTVLLGSLVLLLYVRSYDASAAVGQAGFEAADPTVVVMPFVAFFVGSVGALVVTSEYGTGMIQATLIAVPRRGVLFLAKTLVVAAYTFAAGQLFAWASFAAAWTILGDRPAPLNPWSSFGAALPSVLSTGIVAMVAGLLALGIGAAVRSTAATLVATGGLILVAPIFAHFLPAVWQLRAASVLLPNLAPQLAGADTAYLLTPPQAALVLAGYVAVALLTGGVLLHRRDA